MELDCSQCLTRGKLCPAHRKIRYLAEWRARPESAAVIAKGREAAKARKREYDRQRYLADPDYRKTKTQRLRERLGETEWYRRYARYLRKYGTGMAPELSEKLREHQRGLCAICQRAIDLGREVARENKECGDHCHITGVPRGLLCHPCNVSLGFYEKHQRLVGLRLEPYEQYLANPPVRGLSAKSSL